MTPRVQVECFFQERGWTVFDFQQEVWDAYLSGGSGLIHAPTGTGKSYAAWCGPLLERMSSDGDDAGLKVLWITPLRALAADTMEQLGQPLSFLDIPWTIEIRTGDTSPSVKARQRRKLPDVLITTPESVSLLFTHPGVEDRFSGLQAVVVDEWHELLGSKRGVQTELALARLRRWNPRLRVWGLSATLGNLDEARRALLGSRQRENEHTVRGLLPKEVRIDTLIPDDVVRFPWGGHLGLSMLDPVLDELDDVASALVFTNTRAQAESWFRAIIRRRPAWAGTVALHHGSLDRSTRRWVEQNLASGKLRCVVCTSSLDLGVDFTPVERVFQVGSPKGVARLLQRAGRSGHQPESVSRVTGVPTNAFELVEFAAARRAAERHEIEHRTPVERPLDLLVQHVVTVAAGTGFQKAELFEEVQSAYAFRNLTSEEWEWVLSFAETGGTSLISYDQYQRIASHRDLYRVTTNEVLKRHRMSVGTIVGDALIQVKYQRGQSLGTVEESFLSKLRPGDVFFFAGKALELVRVRDMKAYVKRASSMDGTIPRWMGGYMPLSTQLSAALRSQLTHRFAGPEMEAVAPLLTIQSEWSKIPGDTELLIERVRTKEGYHVFLFPFEGRLVHEGLAALLAYRLSRVRPITIRTSFNDYGIELLASDPPPIEAAFEQGLFDDHNLRQDIFESLNEAEMARRQFREIARVAGLVFQGFPSRQKSTAALQASSGLLFDVFVRHDPKNLLLEQARSEVLSRQLEEDRLRNALGRIQECAITVIDTPRISPLAFPIYVDRIGQHLTSEKLADRIRRMQIDYEKALEP